MIEWPAMLYALTITIAAGLLLIGLLVGITLLARRAAANAERGLGPFAGWRWQPSGLGWLLLVLLPVAGVLLWRVFPVFLFLPLFLPFVWRWRGGGRPMFTFVRRPRSRKPSSNGHRKDEDHAIEGSFRPLDDE
jgi:hypothetical protein